MNVSIIWFVLLITTASFTFVVINRDTPTDSCAE